MSAPAFTPGPWALSPQGGSIAAHPSVTLANGEKRWTTTRICSFSSSGNIEANAALIVAAPDLYAALQFYVDANQTFDFAIVREAEEKAAAALAKARGEQ